MDRRFVNVGSVAMVKTSECSSAVDTANATSCAVIVTRQAMAKVDDFPIPLPSFSLLIKSDIHSLPRQGVEPCPTVGPTFRGA
jgi:hypothetical protein